VTIGPLDSAYVASYWWSIKIMHLSWTVTEIWGPKDIGVTTLTFWWSMMTVLLSCTDTEIRGFRFWDHKFDLLGSRDVIDHVTIGLGVGTFLLVVNDDRASIFIARIRRYGASKILGSRV